MLSQNSSVRRTLLSTPHWQVSSDSSARVVWLERREEPFRSTDEIRIENRRVVELLEPRYAEWGILVDMRRAPPRNDPSFESAMQELRTSVEQRFARAAVLIATQVGLLQINRLNREDNATTFATTDPAAALRFVRGERYR